MKKLCFRVKFDITELLIYLVLQEPILNEFCIRIKVLYKELLQLRKCRRYIAIRELD